MSSDFWIIKEVLLGPLGQLGGSRSQRCRCSAHAPPRSAPLAPSDEQRSCYAPRARPFTSRSGRAGSPTSASVIVLCASCARTSKVDRAEHLRDAPEQKGPNQAAAVSEASGSQGGTLARHDQRRHQGLR